MKRGMFMTKIRFLLAICFMFIIGFSSVIYAEEVDTSIHYFGFKNVGSKSTNDSLINSLDRDRLSNVDYLLSLGFVENDIYVIKTSDYSYDIVKIMNGKVFITEVSLKEKIEDVPIIYSSPQEEKNITDIVSDNTITTRPENTITEDIDAGITMKLESIVADDKAIISTVSFTKNNDDTFKNDTNATVGLNIPSNNNHFTDVVHSSINPSSGAPNMYNLKLSEDFRTLFVDSKLVYSIDDVKGDYIPIELNTTKLNYNFSQHVDKVYLPTPDIANLIDINDNASFYTLSADEIQHFFDNSEELDIQTDFGVTIHKTVVLNDTNSEGEGVISNNKYRLLVSYSYDTNIDDYVYSRRPSFILNDDTTLSAESGGSTEAVATVQFESLDDIAKISAMSFQTKENQTYIGNWTVKTEIPKSEIQSSTLSVNKQIDVEGLNASITDVNVSIIGVSVGYSLRDSNGNNFEDGASRYNPDLSSFFEPNADTKYPIITYDDGTELIFNGGVYYDYGNDYTYDVRAFYSVLPSDNNYSDFIDKSKIKTITIGNITLDYNKNNSIQKIFYKNYE